MGSLSCAVLAALLVLTGCAQGSSGNDSGTARTDSTVIPGRDTSVTQRDTGAMPACTDDAHGSMCERATDLGSLMAGDSITPDPGVLPMSGDEDWFRVDFPPDPMMNMPGGGMPAIEFVMNGGEAFRFEVRGDCMTTLGCGDGMSARDVDSWSFVDDQAMMGEDAWSTRDAPWPAAAVIRVYRPVGMGDCQRYQIRVSR